MDNANTKTALVTGATSGLGFEAAAQLADRGYSRVVVTGRTKQKASDAVSRLEDRSNRFVFEPLGLDLDDLDSVEGAAATLAERGGTIGRVILNAGAAAPQELLVTDSGFDVTVTASLVGHHLLTMRLLELKLLAEDAAIVIAGSEAARGDVPTFNTVDLHAMAREHFGGDLEAAIEAQMRMQAPATYNSADSYATVKLFVAWWAAALARVLPSGMRVNAVSPGSTPDTNILQDAPFYMRRIMVPLTRRLPGMAHSVADGAARYLEVAEYSETGKFYASRPRRLTGPLEEIRLDHILDTDGQRALWNVASRVTGGADYRAA